MITMEKQLPAVITSTFPKNVINYSSSLHYENAVRRFKKRLQSAQGICAGQSHKV